MTPGEIIQTFKELVGLAQSLKNLDMQRKLVDVQGEVIQLLGESHTKDLSIAEHQKRIAELEDTLRFKGKLTREAGAYYEVDQHGHAEGDPYCPRCWEVEHKAVHLHYGQAMKGYQYKCAACRTDYPLVSKVKP